MDPNNKTTEDSGYGSVTALTPEEFIKQEAGYLYRYRYNGGAASQVWLSHGRCGTGQVIDVAANDRNVILYARCEVTVILNGAASQD